MICAANKMDYLIFTSLPEPKKEPIEESESANLQTSRIDNLLRNCNQNRHILRRIKLRIYGLKYGQLHDRYILIVGKDNLPVAGFNLSNSLQATAQHYPLLVTPIPSDVLLDVERYKFELVQKATRC